MWMAAGDDWSEEEEKKRHIYTRSYDLHARLDGRSQGRGI